MKTLSDRAITIALAVLATVLLTTAAFALASPAQPGPRDSALPVIATDVTSEPHETTPAVQPIAPGEPADDGALAEDDADDDHETVAPRIRVEDGDDEKDGKAEDGGHDESDESSSDELPDD